MSRLSYLKRGSCAIQEPSSGTAFMPALVAIRHNADMKAKYNQLIAVGKEKKVAITAVMRKLLVLANALLRDQRKWMENMA